MHHGYFWNLEIIKPNYFNFSSLTKFPKFTHENLLKIYFLLHFSFCWIESPLCNFSTLQPTWNLKNVKNYLSSSLKNINLFFLACCFLFCLHLFPKTSSRSQLNNLSLHSKRLISKCWLKIFYVYFFLLSDSSSLIQIQSSAT